MSGKKRVYRMVFLALFVAAFVAFLVRDLYLTENDGDEEKSTFVVEKVQYRNIIDDSVYILDAQRGWKSNDLYILEDVHITIEGKGGNVWKVQASRGSVPEASGGIVVLKEARGITSIKGDQFHWHSPEVRWKPDEQLFFFDDGIRAFGESIEIRSQNGLVRLSGEMELSGKAEVVYRMHKK